ncbi:hypothetical protein MIT9_P0036 [Methylomarinovum caldicuralii]|uniref:Type II secretion system protein n=1 Tax=Methylomarinovum caldicuralii TaxID=438856 RepID=A0AAU9BP58_9GAMM|nr:type II secretion system protein [Methylomarinovum caldicuralii]BCX80463.1 hypothetical protein MIT9_P0036 [Methylomarinovum caldicuralii]
MNRQAGFSLVEMAVVLAAFSLMLGGMLGPLAKQSRFRKEREAERHLAAITEALYGYALIHETLPDPEGKDVLPWRLLGVPETDPWGRPWRYRSTARTDPCDPGNDIRVRDKEGVLVAQVTAVVLSEGKFRYDSKPEQENRDGDDNFVKDDPQPERFDDLVAWVNPAVLKNRAVLAGVCAKN